MKFNEYGKIMSDVVRGNRAMRVRRVRTGSAARGEFLPGCPAFLPRGD